MPSILFYQCSTKLFDKSENKGSFGKEIARKLFEKVLKILVINSKMCSYNNSKHITQYCAGFCGFSGIVHYCAGLISLYGLTPAHPVRSKTTAPLSWRMS